MKKTEVTEDRESQRTKAHVDDTEMMLMWDADSNCIRAQSRADRKPDVPAYGDSRLHLQKTKTYRAVNKKCP